MQLSFKPGKPPLPKEHGGWAMMLTPPVIALLAVGPSFVGLMAVCGWALAYCLRGPVDALRGASATGRAGLPQAAPDVARFWLMLFALASLALLAPVVWLRPWTLALLLGALALLGLVQWLANRGQTRSITAGLLATAGLMLGGPLYYVASYGSVSAEGWTLALAGWAFFAGSIFRVKTLARERRSVGFRWVSVGIHALAVTLAALVGSWLVAAALLPALAWAVYGAVRAGEPVNLAVIGKGEQWLTIVFGLLLMAALRV